MNDWQDLVAQFHKKIGQPIADEPTAVSLEEWRFRHDLLKEEWDEYRFSTNIIDIADAFADMFYVILGTALVLGIDMDAVFTEVHLSNMTKKKENKTAAGKIMKDKDFQPPEIAKVLGLDSQGFPVIK